MQGFAVGRRAQRAPLHSLRARLNSQQSGGFANVNAAHQSRNGRAQQTNTAINVRKPACGALELVWLLAVSLFSLRADVCTLEWGGSYVVALTLWLLRQGCAGL